MSEIQNIPFPIVFIAGLVVGALIVLLINKLRSGSVSPAKVQKEMDEYKEQVEAHFEETSNKFKDMTTQYQDLYQHLSKGATSLCRPENVAVGLANQGGPLAALENKSAESEQAAEQQQNAKQPVTAKKEADAATVTEAELKKPEPEKSKPEKSEPKR